MKVSALTLMPSNVRIWAAPIVAAAADVNPAVTGYDINWTRKPMEKILNYFSPSSRLP